MRLFRNRAIVTIVTLSLICASSTTAQAGVVPWIWNVFFGPANQPIFPRMAAARQARMGGAYCPPGNGFIGYAPQPMFSNPAYSTSYAPAISYAPAAGYYSTPSYAYSAPIVSDNYLANSYSGTPFEYSGYVTGCGCSGTSSFPAGGTVISDEVTGTGTSDKDETAGGADDDKDGVYSPPNGVEDSTESPRPNAGDGMEGGRGDRGSLGGGSNSGIADDWQTPNSKGSGQTGDDGTDLYKVDKPVSDGSDTGDVPKPPASKAPSEPEARRSTPEVITTVSLTGELGRDGQLHQSRASLMVLKNKKTQRLLRWISVPSDGRTVVR